MRAWLSFWLKRVFAARLYYVSDAVNQAGLGFPLLVLELADQTALNVQRADLVRPPAKQ